jgi:hypothetical protein
MVQEGERAGLSSFRTRSFFSHSYIAVPGPQPSPIAGFRVIAVFCPRSGFQVEPLQIWLFRPIRCQLPRSNE